jgi:hypothetical protein
MGTLAPANFSRKMLKTKIDRLASLPKFHTDLTGVASLHTRFVQDLVKPPFEVVGSEKEHRS